LGPKKIRERAPLIELCSVLKEEAKGQGPPLLVLIPKKHRILMTRLRDAGVDFVRIVGDTPLSSEQLLQTVQNLERYNRLPLMLEAICPYIHYKAIDTRRELSVCAADQCRLVLGPARLANLCEIEGHVACTYFKETEIRQRNGKFTMAG
jgi:hypothetical protein